MNAKIIEGACTSSQKQDIVRRLTDAMVEIEGKAMQPVPWIVVEEVASGDGASEANRLPRPTSRPWPPGSPWADDLPPRRCESVLG